MSGAPVSVRAHVLAVERRLRDARVSFGHGTDNARDEAVWMVAAAWRRDPRDLAGEWARPLPGQARARLRALLAARIRSRAPLAYVLREAWFAGRRFRVDARVIVPRSLIGEFLRPGAPSPLAPPRIGRILDLCTGSGAIAVAAAYCFRRAHIDAVDLSPLALQVAAYNRARHGFNHRITLIQSDLFATLGKRRYDLILCNPPYVTDAEMRTLPREYQREPRLALAGGYDGLDLVRPILATAADHLTARGRLVLEVGASRAHLEACYPEAPCVWLATSNDECVGYWRRADLAAFASPATGHSTPSLNTGGGCRDCSS